jgi:hypothetical protein
VLTLQAARALAKSYIGTAAVGKDPEAERKAAKAAQKSIRLGALCDLYVENHAKPHKKPGRPISLYSSGSSSRNLKTGCLRRSTGDLLPIHKVYGAEHPDAANTLLKVYRRTVNWAKDDRLLPRDYDNRPTHDRIWPRA